LSVRKTVTKTTTHINLETATKKSIVVIALVVLSFAFAQNAMAQATANQSLSLKVNIVYQIAICGNPGAMTLTTGTAEDVDNSATTPASAANVVTNIVLGADAIKSITCISGAFASSGVLPSAAKVVTLTLTLTY
jgi:hypothetical protein